MNDLLGYENSRPALRAGGEEAGDWWRIIEDGDYSAAVPVTESGSLHLSVVQRSTGRHHSGEHKVHSNHKPNHNPILKVVLRLRMTYLGNLRAIAPTGMIN